MIREHDGMVGTEWQVVQLEEDYAGGAGLKMRERLAWIREYEGYGKVYYDNIFSQIYFERDEDREMFILRWM